MPDTSTQHSRYRPGEPIKGSEAESELTPLSTWVYAFLTITAVAGLVWAAL